MIVGVVWILIDISSASDGYIGFTGFFNGKAVEFSVSVEGSDELVADLCARQSRSEIVHKFWKP